MNDANGQNFLVVVADAGSAPFLRLVITVSAHTDRTALTYTPLWLFDRLSLVINLPGKLKFQGVTVTSSSPQAIPGWS